jgi:restriction endonuclease S subunit
MRTTIKNIATVQMGYSFRSRLETANDGNVTVIQMKDLPDNNTVNCDKLTRINMKTIKQHHLAIKGDLIFRSRGLTTTSAILSENPGKAVIAAPLLRIRVCKPDKVLPEYLNWYINQRDAQRYFTSRQEGTSVNMISQKQLKEMPVVVPHLEQQKNIVELASLSAQEQNILNTLAEKRKQYISATLMQFVKGE